MKINIVLCAVLAMVVIDVNADDVVKGRVGVSLYPTIEEVADAYEKSEMSDWRVVAGDLVKSRNTDRKKYGIANSAEVELQALPGFKVLRKVKVDDKGEYITKIKDDDPDCRVFCRYEMAGRVLTGTAYTEWNKFEHAFSQSLLLSSDYAAVVGRCVDTNGLPVVDARVDVDIVTTPTEVDGKWYKTQVGKTDKDGRWIVEGVDKPSFWFMLGRLANTNVVNREDSRVPPYGIKVFAYRIPEFKVCGSIFVPNVTARDRVAAERIFAAYKRKTGKEWPRPAPMTDFPVSTNNVIYVPDIVLK